MQIHPLPDPGECLERMRIEGTTARRTGVEPGALDTPLLEFARAAQAAGALQAGLAPWWIVSTLYSITYSAWEGVAAGRLAPLDAPGIAFDTITAGIGARR